MIFSNKTEPAPWPSGVNLQPESPRLQVLHVQPSESDNAASGIRYLEGHGGQNSMPRHDNDGVKPDGGKMS